jgi:type VI secretion system protein ImpA
VSDRPHASPPTFDVEALLNPIADDAPTGRDLRTDDSAESPYYKIKDARNAARAAERLVDQGLTDAEPPDWSPVLEMAPKLLTEASKDLEIVAWYVEALIRTHGFAGARDGFKLADGLCARFWDGLYPAPGDGEGIEVRVAPLAGLNGDDAPGTLVGPIKNVRLTDSGSVGPFSSWQYEQAVEVDKIADPDARQRRLAAGAVAMADVRQAVSETPLDFFRALRDDLAQAREEFSGLGRTLDAKAGADSPPASNIRNALEKVEESFGFLTTGLPLDEPPAADEEAAAGGGGSTRQGGTSGVIRDREEAFQQLEKVASWFRAAEPHSPVSYALMQAVRWGRMPLPELLAELIPEEAARASIFRVTGIAGPAASSSQDAGGNGG